MATQAQIEANRRNSQKSTGPRTAAGKASSSQNALKHGLFSEAIVIPDDENAADFEALQRDYFETCQPEGRLEIALVLELVRCDWLTRRVTAMETQLWTYALDDRRGWMGDNFNEDTPLAHGHNYLRKDLVLIQRRLTALSRAWHRAHADLQKLQAARRGQTSPSRETQTRGQTSRSQPVHHPGRGQTCLSPGFAPPPQIGFVPKILPSPAPAAPSTPPPDLRAPHVTLEFALP